MNYIEISIFLLVTIISIFIVGKYGFRGLFFALFLPFTYFMKHDDYTPTKVPWWIVAIVLSVVIGLFLWILIV